MLKNLYRIITGKIKQFKILQEWYDRLVQWMYENRNRVLLYLVLFLFSVIGTWFTYQFAIDFSAIPITFIYILIFFAFFELFDKKILIGINTIHELNQGNQAVAQFYIAISIILLAVAVMVG